jgi:hypothetical protein
MRSASFVLRTPPDTEHHFIRSGQAWTFGIDQLGHVLAVLRDATRWFCEVWQFDPATGRIFGIRSGITTHRAAARIHLKAARWSAWAPSATRLQLPYTDLYDLRQRLFNQQQAIRRATRREALHGIHAH